MLKFNKPRATGKINEESTATKLGIHPNPPRVNSVNVICACTVFSGNMYTKFLRLTENETHIGIWNQINRDALKGWQLSLTIKLFHCFLT